MFYYETARRSPQEQVSILMRIMSAVGTTLLQSPGCNEGKARYETLGIHEPKVISSSVGAVL